MATNEQLYALATTAPSGLKNRIEGAWMKALDSMMLEDPGTPNHTKRLELVQKTMVTEGRQKLVTMFVAKIVTNGTFQTADATGDNITDNDLDYLVSYYAGKASFVDAALANL